MNASEQIHSDMISDLAARYNISKSLAEIAHSAFCGCMCDRALLFAEYAGISMSSNLRDWLVFAQNISPDQLEALTT